MQNETCTAIKTEDKTEQLFRKMAATHRLLIGLVKGQNLVKSFFSVFLTAGAYQHMCATSLCHK